MRPALKLRCLQLPFDPISAFIRYIEWQNIVINFSDKDYDFCSAFFMGTQITKAVNLRKAVT